MPGVVSQTIDIRGGNEHSGDMGVRTHLGDHVLFEILSDMVEAAIRRADAPRSMTPTKILWLVRTSTGRCSCSLKRALWPRSKPYNQAEAMRIFAKQVELGLDAQSRAAVIKLRAERKAAELLTAMNESGERHSGHGDQRAESQASTSTLDGLGITKSPLARPPRSARGRRRFWR